MADTLNLNTSAQKGSKSVYRAWLRPLVRLVLVFMICVLLGFAFFLSTIASYERDSNALKADAIVVLTGGFARLEPAVELLKEKRGERLLISGVNRQTNDSLLKNVLNIDDSLYNCCVDIDQDAMNTIGNAVGTAHWVKAKNYNHIIVVTNDYHMPRGLMEIKRVLPDVTLTPFAVRNRKTGEVPLSVVADRYRVLIGEYGKFTASFLRGFFEPKASRTLDVISGASTGW